jgi:hypothetical protein
MFGGSWRIKFLIPSKGRSDVIGPALDFVGRSDLVVLVDEDEEKEYRRVVGEPARIETHPGLYGMGAILNHGLSMLLDEDYVVILADDCYAFCYKFAPVKSPPTSRDSEKFRHAIRNTYFMANDLKTPLFGWSYDKGIYFYNHLNPFGFSGYIIGGLHGIIPKYLGDAMYDPRLVIGEDHDFSLQVKYYHRFFVMDLRYAIVDKTWTNKGGCSTLRHSDVYKERNRILKQKWGDVVQVNPKKPKQIKVRVPF